MKIFGKIEEITQVILRKASRKVTIDPATQTVGDATLTVPDLAGVNRALVTDSSTQTLTNKTLTSPAISSPTGLVKGDVGLGNVDNTSDATKNAAAVTLTNKKLDDTTTRVVDTSDPTVELEFDVTGTTGTKTKLFTSQTANRNIVLPDAAGTLGLVPSAGPVRSSGTSLTTGATDLASEVTGTLPLGNGGTNTTAISSGIVRSNGTALSGAGTVALGSEVIGTLPIGNGGTGQNTASGAINALVPSQTGNNGRVLGTDGSVVSWVASAAVPPTAGSVYSDGSALQSTAFSGNGNKVQGVNSAGTSEEMKTIAVGTSGTDFAVAHSAGTITLNLPDASASNRGAITTGAQTIAGNKTLTGETIIGPADSGADHSLRGNVAITGKTGTQTYLDVRNNGGTSFFHVNSASQTRIGRVSGYGADNHLVYGGVDVLNDSSSNPTLDVRNGNGSGPVIYVLAGSDNNDTKAVEVQRTGGTDLFNVRNNGKILVNTTSWSTGGTAIGVSGGLLTTSPSSARYKTNITDLALDSSIDSSQIYNLRSVSFDYIAQRGGGKSFGLIAEEAVNILPCIVHQEGGIPESVDYAKLSILLLEEIKKLRDRIEALEAAP